jgi:hypothetical protein
MTFARISNVDRSVQNVCHAQLLYYSQYRVYPDYVYACRPVYPLCQVRLLYVTERLSTCSLLP